MKLSAEQLLDIKNQHLNTTDNGDINFLLAHIQALEFEITELKNDLTTISNISKKSLNDLVKENFKDICNEYVECPKCHGETEVRTNSKTGRQFVGCANFPVCRWTKTARSYSRSYNELAYEYDCEDYRDECIYYDDFLG